MHQNNATYRSLLLVKVEGPNRHMRREIFVFQEIESIHGIGKKLTVLIQTVEMP